MAKRPTYKAYLAGKKSTPVTSKAYLAKYPAPKPKPKPAPKPVKPAGPVYQRKLGFDPARIDPLQIPTGDKLVWQGAGAPNLSTLAKRGLTDLTVQRD